MFVPTLYFWKKKKNLINIAVFGIKMFAARGVLRLAQRLGGVSVSRRGCAGAVPLDDVVNGLTDEQIQVH